MRILVVGGAGYIGRITCDELAAAGHEVTIFDHFVTHNTAKAAPFPYINGDITDKDAISEALGSVRPDAVMHFAAAISMGESVKDPKKYYDNNVLGSKILVEAMIKAGVKQLVFSSTAGVYGNVDPSIATQIPESAAGYPTNPYGETKLTIERLLKWYESPYGLRSICIRYFNAAGATLDGGLGEDHASESHIIPNVIKAQKEGVGFTLFGNDYDTPDGTCVRDYVHVVDLARAHVLAVESLAAGAASTIYNAGTGHGYSNLEIIKMVEAIAGLPVKVNYAPRRPGDAGTLVADASRLRQELGWDPKHSDLETIIKTAYAWHNKK